MSGMIVQNGVQGGLQDGADGELIIRQHGGLRRITLNRPKALNALTLDMAVQMTTLLRSWAADPAVGAVLLDGAGERGLCAGGDIRALYDAAKSGDTLPEKFWATEYHLDVLIARYPKPFIAVMDGMVMGGGVGLSTPAAHRIVTERSAVAMPEVGIGFFPDVGASYLLARAPGFSGTYMALTGDRMAAADAIYCGLADIHIPAAKLAELAGCARRLPVCRRRAQATRRPLQPASRGQDGRGAAMDRRLLWRQRYRNHHGSLGCDPMRKPRGRRSPPWRKCRRPRSK